MKVILTQDIPHIGAKNTLQEVKPGHANNYLIPNGLAIIANRQNQKVAQENERQAAYKQKRLKEEAEALAQKIEETSFVLEAKASDNGKIFGSITPLQIATLLKNEGILLDFKNISIQSPIKDVDKTYEAHISLHQGIQATLRFQVKASKAKKA